MSKKEFLCGKKVMNLIRKQVEESIERSEPEIDGIEKKAMELDVFSQSRFANLMNEFVRYIDPFNLKCLQVPLINSKSETRKKNELQVEIISRTERGLKEVELFSAISKAKIEDGKVEKKAEGGGDDDKNENSVEEEWRDMLSDLVPQSLKNPAKRAYFSLLRYWQPAESRDYRMREEYVRRLEDRDWFSQCVANPYIIQVKDLARLEYLAVGLETLSSRMTERS